MKEISLADLCILIFGLILFKEVYKKIFFLTNSFFFKNFIFILVSGLIGIIISFFQDTDKIENIFFLITFYLNIIKIFLGFIIFLILSDKYNYISNERFLIFITIILITTCFFNFFINGHISRFYYPFTTKTIGYNLIGLVMGVLFFSIINYYNIYRDKKYLLFLLFLVFLIVLFSFSKTAIISLILTFLFYHLIFIKYVDKKFFYLNIIFFIILIISLDILKIFFDINSFSFLDIIQDPISWFDNYGSFYYRIDHVWLSNFDKNLNIYSFLFGEGIYSPKTHDSLYFTIISRFGFVGLYFFFKLVLNFYKLFRKSNHNILSYVLIFGITTEMFIQSNVVNPLILILFYNDWKLSK